MILEYEKPAVEIISFLAMERLATDDEHRSGARSGDDSVGIPKESIPNVKDEVEDW